MEDSRMNVKDIIREKLKNAGYSTENNFVVEENRCSLPGISITEASDLMVYNKDHTDTLILVECCDNNEALGIKYKRITDIRNTTTGKLNIIAIIALAENEDTKINVAMWHKDLGRVNLAQFNCSGLDIASFDAYKNIINKLNGQAEEVKVQKRKENTLNISTTIWNIADILRGSFREPDYGNVIIPMTILARFDAELKSTKQAVLDSYNSIIEMDVPHSDKVAAIMSISNHYFYNTSGYGLSEIARYDNYETFIDYIDGYSDNVIEILNRLDFRNTVSKLDDANLIYSVVSSFTDIQDDLLALQQDDMGMLFEELIRKFSEKDNDGEHFTSPDIVKLCCALLIDSDEDKIRDSVNTYNIYDQAMGTSQMLTVMSKFIKDLNPDNVCNLYGQEINPKTWGMASANELIKSEYDINKPFKSKLMLGNTLTDDKLKGYKFDYCISNPPFGVKWDMYASYVESDPKFYNIGLPAKSDGQMLFDLNGFYHLNEHGRMAIIHNGSTLFSGGPGSGESKIRQYLISNDYVEAIVKLPNDLFYNTGITTYIWVLTKEKKENRKGKIQLIDASGIFKKLRKSQGSRKNEITDGCRELIFNTLNKFEEAEYELEGTAQVCKSKILDNEYFKGEPDNQGRYKWEMPFDKLFYVAEEKQDSETIKQRIIKLNAKIQQGMTELFGE